jgi:hypothetical protein
LASLFKRRSMTEAGVAKERGNQGEAERTARQTAGSIAAAVIG